MKLYGNNLIDLVEAADEHRRTDNWKVTKCKRRFFGSGYVAILKRRGTK